MEQRAAEPRTGEERPLAGARIQSTVPQPIASWIRMSADRDHMSVSAWVAMTLTRAYERERGEDV